MELSWIEWSLGQKRMQPRVFGHKAGMEALQEVTIAAKEMGVQAPNGLCSQLKTGRPQQEVSFIMNLPVEFYDRLFQKK